MGDNFSNGGDCDCKSRIIFLCPILRYNPFFREIKNLFAGKRKSFIESVQIKKTCLGIIRVFRVLRFRVGVLRIATAFALGFVASAAFGLWSAHLAFGIDVSPLVQNGLDDRSHILHLAGAIHQVVQSRQALVVLNVDVGSGFNQGKGALDQFFALLSKLVPNDVTLSGKYGNYQVLK